MTVENSFSFLLPNLFIGLCKGARALRPYSEEFRKELGYEIFGLERSFPMTGVHGRRLTPDLILTSYKVGCTLLVEWTGGTVSGDKQDQLSRYSMVHKADLTDVLAIPPQCCRCHEVVLILKPEAVNAFERFLDDEGISIPIVTFSSSEEGYCLRTAAHSFRELRTDDFFAQAIEFTRIGKFYLPFSLEGVTPQTVVRFIRQELVSMLA